MSSWTRSKTARLAITVALLAVLGGVIVWRVLAPRGFVDIRGEVGEERVAVLARLDHGGISTPEHYLRLKRRGRLSYFGARPAGSVFLWRTAGAVGRWYCGRVASGTYDFREGELAVREVTMILDEAAPRGQTLTISGVKLPWGAGECGPPAAEGVIERAGLRRAASSVGRSTAVELGFEHLEHNERLALELELAGAPPETGEQPIRYASVVHATYGDAPTRYVYVGGEGSRMSVRDGCARIELVVTEAGVCRPEGGEGYLNIRW